MHWTFHNRQRTNLFVDSLVNDTGDNVTVSVSLFLEDLELFLQDSINSGLLLFADDMAIFGKSTEDRQHYIELEIRIDEERRVS